MKKVEAIIRKSKFKEVKKALLDANIEYFSYWLVRDKSKEKEKRFYRGVEYETPASERIWVTLMVADNKIGEVIELIRNAGRTGDVGDGRIFITDIVSAHLIRTDDEGDKILGMDD